MKHPEFVLIPVLMFADYFLTLTGAALKDRKYGNHIKTEHYELNPIWQKQIAQKKWLNPKHIVLTFVLSSFIILMTEYGEMPEPFTQGIWGCLLALYGMIIGRHLSNVMIFGYMIRKPNEIHGQVTMTHALVLSLSLYQYLVVFVPLTLIAIFSPNPFIFGAAIGVVLLTMIHLKWIWTHRKQMRTSNKEAKITVDPQ